jgi:hypothetical protein
MCRFASVLMSEGGRFPLGHLRGPFLCFQGEKASRCCGLPVAMGFLALVTRQTRAQIAIEREQLATISGDSIKAIQSARRDAVALRQQLEERLAQLPAEIAEGIPQLLPLNSARVCARSWWQVAFQRQHRPSPSSRNNEGCGRCRISGLEKDHPL